MPAPSNPSARRTMTLPQSLPAKPVPAMPPPPTTVPRIPSRATAEVAVPSSTPSEKQTPPAPASASNGPVQSSHPAYVAAQAVTTPHCFVKGVTKWVSQPALTEQLSHFGTIKELDIVRTKACAFVEFTTVEAARLAITASLPVAQGGGGGVRVEASGEVPTSVRITIEVKRARGDRPVSRPRGGAFQSETRDGGVGGSGFRGGLGRGLLGSGTRQTPSAPAPAANGPVRTTHPAYVAAQAVTTSHCFVKGVTEPVSQSALTAQLASFGTIKEIDIVRSKACAFVEFTSVDAAKRAIVASLPAAQGGGGGIWVEASGGVPSVQIAVEVKRERSDRPVNRPRGGAPQDETRGGSGGGFRGARGRGGRGAVAGGK
ncbi:hypothetical protein ARMSODRAFT_957846 [Armillaria solidipes]|uniref:RRM domain-containing protein n=1 Tax=Armillaria solidipes TaxID=1076256 RepID=A0A2H3BRV8_9AGAR|nr:hypothetical protein ARMSODRAFT_957846 [Armillaria solidipes]